MNTSSDSERSGTGPEGPHSGSSFFGWLRGLGIVRGSDRWFAGVAGGIAAKAGIDPLIVRGVFVVLALLGGPGLLIYLVGWLLLPDAQGRIHTEDIFRGRAETWVLVTSIVLASVLIIPAIFGLALTGVPLFGAPNLWGWDLWATMGIPEWLTRTVAWLFWITILVLGFFWLRSAVLKRGREQGGRPDARPSATNGSPGGDAPTAPMPAPVFAADADGTATERIDSAPTSTTAGTGTTGTDDAGSNGAADPSSTGAAAGSGAPSDGARSFTDRTEEFANRTAQQAADWGQRFGEQAGRWGEDVGRQADEWSARYAQHHDAHRLGAAHTVLTIALALLAAGATVLWARTAGLPPAAPGIGDPMLPWVLALTAALAVFGVSLIIAGVRGRYTGWVGFLSACGVVALLFTVVLPWGMRFQPFGNLHVAGEDAPGAVTLAGNTTVDLRDLDGHLGIDGHIGEDSDLQVWLLAGNVRVELPEEHPVMLEVRVLAGNIGEDGDDGRRTSGPFLSRTISANLPAGGGSAEDIATVTVYLLAGNVRVSEPMEASSPSTLREEPREEPRELSEERLREADEQRERIADRLDLVEWRLEEPGLSTDRRQALEEQRDRLVEELNELEQEMAR